jgi:hypothetical protein
MLNVSANQHNNGAYAKGGDGEHLQELQAQTSNRAVLVLGVTGHVLRSVVPSDGWISGTAEGRKLGRRLVEHVGI